MKHDKNLIGLVLDLDLDPNTRWSLLLSLRHPGRIEESDLKYPQGAMVRPLVFLVDPHETVVDTLKSREGGDLDPGTLVEFSLQPMPRTDNRYHSEAVDLVSISRKRLDELRADYENAILDRLVKQVDDQLPASGERLAQLVSHIETQVSERLESRMKDIREKESDLQRQIRALKSERQEFAAQKQAVAAERADLQRQLRRWAESRGVAPPDEELATDEKDQRQSPDIIQKPEPDIHSGEQVSQLHDLLTESGLRISPEILRQFLSAIFCGVASGELVILAGPPGVGKTSIVEQVAPAIGAGSGIVPVRPAWTDSTDLFGFFNPVHRVYQPTPFVEQLLLAGQHQEADLLYMICLDEVNLARIENYAADLLAKLEKSRGGDAQIDLYARTIAECLRSEHAELASMRDELTPEQSARVVELESTLHRYPPQLDLPLNLVILGTVNVDETTYMLSPKVLDRAFVVQLPRADWSQVTNGRREALHEPLIALSTAWIHRIAGSDLPPGVDEKSAQLWEHLCRWQDHYLEPLGVHASYRLASSFRRFMRISHYGLSMDPEEAASAFVQMRVLPRVSFTRDQSAVRSGQRRRIEIYNEWRGDSHLKEFPGLEKVLEAMDERSPGPVLQYWQ